MIEVTNQQSFWNSIIPVISLIIGSLLTMLINCLKERSNRTTQLKIEKLKIYDEKRFQAYLELSEFISIAKSYYPPNNARQDFIHLMKKHFFTKVKINYPYFKNGIREKIKIFENQYDCLGEDFIPQIPFEEFYRSEYIKILHELNQIVEKSFDEWEKL